MYVETARTFSASPTEVHATLVAPATQAAKAEALGALDYRMATKADGDRLEVVTRRRLATTRMPEFVRSLVNPSITVVETERWDAPGSDGSRVAEFLLDIDGAPIKLRGSTYLTVVDGGSQLRWTGDLEATVPFFRSKITESAVASVLETIEVEYEILERTLTGTRAG
ncbi:DUF2505 domain-containing protein [Nocardia sp. 004]|uniref:DUF2505 domain-containing protein n=1 Tax=Nocardia sp. 004 TaxID=3385978 RepID=UPI0039A37338